VCVCVCVCCEREGILHVLKFDFDKESKIFIETKH